MNILTLNAGSNSLKFEIVAAQRAEPESEKEVRFGTHLISGAYDDIGKESSTFSLRQNKHDLQKQQIKIRDHGHATELLFQRLGDGGAREYGIRDIGDIDRIGDRIVHGADLFRGPAQITGEVIRQIEQLEELAPLHNFPR